MFRLPVITNAILLLGSLVAERCCANWLYADEGEETANSEQMAFFEREVRPVLVEHCYGCHSRDAKKVQAGLILDSRKSLLKGGDSGPALIPGNADESLIVQAVRYEAYEMPPKGKLSPSEIEAMEKWVKMGAPWPKEPEPESGPSRASFDLQKRKQEHWVWQPIESPQIPPVVNREWPSNSMDHFILSKLESNGLAPAEPTDRSALVRRLYFDLLGLPPSPVELRTAIDDKGSDAIERLIDKLLESPHFGERWGRHWLDLVRYAESRGHEFDNDTPNAYQYRDYVIRALNADVPYDQFIQEHIAGDLLSPARLHPKDGYNESILGTGFWFLGEWVHSPVDIRKDETDRFDNMIDVMSKTFLGVTVSCARCHDHKFDAISTADYYSLCGFLQSSDFREVRFETLEHDRVIASKLAEIDSKYRVRSAEILEVENLRSPATAGLSQAVQDHFVVDYTQLGSEELLQDGFVFGNAPRRAGDIFVEVTENVPSIQFAKRAGAINDSFWNPIETSRETENQDKSRLAKIPRSGRTLRSPTFELRDGVLNCRVRGSGHIVACVDSHRLIAGPLHGETVQSIKADQRWVKLNLSRYVGHRLHLEFIPDNGKQLEVSLVVQGASQTVLDEIANWETQLETQWEAFSKEAIRRLTEQAPTLATEWEAERALLQTQWKRRSRVAMAMLDGTGEDDRILIRGNSSKPGEIVHRRFLEAVDGQNPMKIEAGSGRLELSKQITDPANPLTPRVIVNRIWHHMMSRGIVATTDDFGVLGQRPTHPELLDHLASTFLKDGQSIKRLIRRIALSSTYRMSSTPNPTAMEIDPKNLLWHHRSPKRLEGEVIRDSLLSLAGRIDLTPFGEPVPIHLNSFMDGRGRPSVSGPLDGAGRRSIYVAVRRNFLSPFLLAFDTPSPFSTMGRRNVSNVPAQSLILLNDPFVMQQAKEWTNRSAVVSQEIRERIAWLYQSAFARQPTTEELEVAISFIQGESLSRGVSSQDGEIWTDLAHVLINTKEFVFLR